MMSPLARTLFCLLGAAAAGAPLLWLTAPAGQNAPACALPQAGAQAAERMLLTLLYSGAPRRLVILHEGRELLSQGAAELSQAHAGRLHAPLELPLPTDGSALELEVQTEWAAQEQGAQAVTLELAPPGRPARQDTHWASPETRKLHDVFIFKW